MTDHPILFSAPMVRALLDGRKTQTRRVLSPHNLRIWTGGLDHGGRYVRPDQQLLAGATNNARMFRRLDDCLTWVTDPAPHQTGAVMAQWQGRLTIARGDRLWVRETWQTGATDDGPKIAYRATPDHFHIDAWDGPDEGIGPSFNYDRCPGATWSTWLPDLLNGREGAWRTPIHMPRWASRLTLLVDDVRVQRLQEINAEDAAAEGVPTHVVEHTFRKCYRDDAERDAKRIEYFGDLWNSINGAGAWNANPWVVALAFRVVRANIDSPDARAA